MQVQKSERKAGTALRHHMNSRPPLINILTSTIEIDFVQYTIIYLLKLFIVHFTSKYRPIEQVL